MKNFNDFLNELYGSNAPIPLTKLKPELANAAISGGDKNKDKIEVNKEDKMAVGELKPAQTEVIASKALGFALANLNPDPSKRKPSVDDMQAIVSSDNYIMDGHHRWAAAWLLNPEKQVKFVRINMKGTDLVTALNIYTKGALKKEKGNTGSGNIADFSTNLNNVLDILLKKGIEGLPKELRYSEDGKKFFWVLEGDNSIEKLKDLLKNIEGAKGNWKTGVKLFKEHASTLPTQKMPGAPARIDMPVVDANKTPKGEDTDDVTQSALYDVCKKIENGEIDLNPDYNPETQKTLKGNKYSSSGKMRHRLPLRSNQKQRQQPAKPAQAQQQKQPVTTESKVFNFDDFINKRK